MSDDDRLALLQPFLALAVAVETENTKRLPLGEVMRLGRAAADIVASKGDIIQFRSKKRGETATAFAELARGVAAASFCPGGIRVLGLRFESRHPEQDPERS